MNLKIVHLTSAHPRYDTRIFYKQCISLSKRHNVSLIVADNNGDEINKHIHIYDVGKLQGRWNRFIKTTDKIFQKAVILNADIYHLHDPELILIGLKLKKLGKKVIFDAHEDLPKQMLSKPYLNTITKNIASFFITYLEKYTCKKFDAIVTATPYIRDKFLTINSNTIDINNFPIISELENTCKYSNKKNEICYIGYISKVRGIKEMVQAMDYVDNCKLNLAGTFNDTSIESEVKALKGWEHVNELGFLDRNAIKDVLCNSKAGLVTLHPIENYLDALPVKMFEYMLAGVPVICSDFPLLKKIIDEAKCGICVNPLDPKEIADAIEYVLTHPKEAATMGENGKQAVLTHYNWANEEAKLFKLYEELL